jgi:ribosome-associated toxin RatA of RatAB toxin-antitoxin module
MRKRIAIAGTGLLALLLAVAASRDERLDDGDILVSTIPIEGSEFPKVRVEAIVDASPDAVWKIVKDCRASQRVNSRVSQSRVVRTIGDDLVCREEVDMPFPFHDMTTVTRWKLRPGPPTWKRSWTLVEGDFDYSNGAWTLKPFGNDQTHAIYENHFKPQMSVPDWLVRAFLKVGMPGMMKDLRKAVGAK